MQLVKPRILTTKRSFNHQTVLEAKPSGSVVGFEAFVVV
jgi:hypothetical protein